MALWHALLNESYHHQQEYVDVSWPSSSSRSTRDRRDLDILFKSQSRTEHVKRGQRGESVKCDYVQGPLIVSQKQQWKYQQRR